VPIHKRKGAGKMIIAIWFIGIAMIWMLTLVRFNEIGYWTPTRLLGWIAVWTGALMAWTYH
jgi:hypothetical protein